jgi:glycosyltransferase 2 family protein
MKKKLGALVRVVVSVGILAYLFHGIFKKEALDYFQAHNLNPDTLSWSERTRIIWSVGPQVLWDAVRKVDALWLTAAVICAGLPAVLGILRWKWILDVQGLTVKFSRLFSISFIGLFFNAFMLGSTGGDVIKAWYVAHETHHKKAEAIATVVVDRLIGLLALFVIALFMMALYHTRVFNDPKMFWFSMATLGVVVFTLIGTVVGLWPGFVDKFPGLRSWLQRMPHYAMLRRMVDAYRVYASHPMILMKTFLISFVVHFFSMLSIWCVGRGLGVLSASFTDYFLYLPIINSVTAVPITISGFGVREGMYIKMFHEVGVAEPVALVMSLLGYLASLFWSIVGGVFFLTHRKELPPTDQMGQLE